MSDYPADVHKKQTNIQKNVIFLTPNPLLTPVVRCVFKNNHPFLRSHQQRNDMKKPHPLYAAFARLSEDGVRGDFPAFCRRRRVLPGVLNEYLLRELGESGEALMTRCVERICEKSQK